MPDLPHDAWLHPSVRARPSVIAGTGLFTTEPIAAGTAVIRVSAAILVGNHSCDANLGWSGGGTLCALRDIAAGEELTNEYATSTADPDFLLRCHCESPRCRGMVEGDDWQVPELQRRYHGYWAPTLQHRIDRPAE